ncbi:MAG TPA: glycosyltransferase family 39 protein [Methylophilaceae bacterium]|nr:glycosyltransferase family 39 protein [Methylophilaceae bacterium]
MAANTLTKPHVISEPAVLGGRTFAGIQSQRLFNWQFLVLASIWLLLALIELFGRSFIPVDETRYVTVAWNMHLSGDFLVPMLNGMPYSDKPPLLFWLINLGWSVFGVSDWWPRLLTCLVALGNAWLIMLLARRLWPQLQQTPMHAALMLSGTALWAALGTAVMFDMLLALFTLLGMLGLVMAMQDRIRAGWALFAMAIAGGLLAKGPAIFLHVLPAMLLAPWWLRSRAMNWRYWYAGAGAASAIGISLALLWAIPAALHGGEHYAQAILWGQSAHRLVNAFAHQREVWWYLPLLPILFFPWLLWGALWKAAVSMRKNGLDEGTRFCLSWLGSTFVLFSLVSGKQIHYLLPLLPAFALLAARVLQETPKVQHRQGLPVLLVIVGLAILLLHPPAWVEDHPATAWVVHIPTWTPLLLIAGSAGLWFGFRNRLQAKLWALALVSMLLAGVIHLGVIRAAGTAYDVRPIAHHLEHLEQIGVPLAHAGPYPGIYDFIGRLQQSPQVLDRPHLSQWFAEHPEGRAVIYFNRKNPLDGLDLEFLQDYLKMQVGVVDNAQWETWCSAHPANCGRPGSRPLTSGH